MLFVRFVLFCALCALCASCSRSAQDGAESLRALATGSSPEPGDATNPRGSPSALSPTVRRVTKGDVRGAFVIGGPGAGQLPPSVARGVDESRADADLGRSPPVDVESGLRRLRGAQEGQEAKNEEILVGNEETNDMATAMTAEISMDDVHGEKGGTGVGGVPPSAVAAGAVGDQGKGLRRRAKGRVAFKRETVTDGGTADEISAKETLLRVSGRVRTRAVSSVGVLAGGCESTRVHWFLCECVCWQTSRSYGWTPLLRARRS